MSRHRVVRVYRGFSPWRIFFNRVRRGDLEGIQYLWVYLMAGACLAILYVLRSYILSTVIVAGAILIAVGLTTLAYKLVTSRLAAEKKKSPVAKSKIRKAPGANLLSLVEFFYSQKTVEEVFKPIIADWRTEYFDALEQGRTFKARWICVRYRYSFIAAIGLSKIYKVYSLFQSILSAGK